MHEKVPDRLQGQLSHSLAEIECPLYLGRSTRNGHVAEFCQCPLSCLRERVMSWFGSQRMTVVKGAPHLPFCDVRAD